MSRPRLHCDFETFSPANLRLTGEEVYSHKAIPLLTGLKVNNAPTAVYDHSEEFNEAVDDWGDFDPNYAIEPPQEYLEAIKDDWYFVAHVAAFEFAIIRNSPALRLWPKPRIERIICTAAKARYWGIADSLENAGSCLEIPIQKQAKRGKQLIQKFCVPQRTGRLKSAPSYIPIIRGDDPEWLEFIDYNHDDVEAEHGVDIALPDIPEKFDRVRRLDMRMNLRGFPVDIDGVKAAVKYYDFFYAKLENRFQELSGGLQPTQVAAITKLLNDEYHCGLPDLTGPTIRDALLESDFFHSDAKEMLEIRSETAASSVKKLHAFLNRTGSILRSMGGLLWYGAHTGRWSGRGVQVHNFPRGVKASLKLLRAFWAWIDAVGPNPTRADLEAAELVFPRPIEVLSAALRGFIRVIAGRLLLAADYSQIELRVLAWLAGETELLEQLRAGLDPYIQFAGNYMYDVPPESLAKDSLERQIAKSALLGAQYQIWIFAFIEYCKKTANIKITIEQATNAVLSYRKANPNIVEFWADIEKACIYVIESRGEASLNNLRLKFEIVEGREWLRIYMPNGRPLSYFKPQVHLRVTEVERKDKDGNVKIGADGLPETYTQRKKVMSFLTDLGGRVGREYTYGGKITQNVTEAVAAEIMGHGMLMAEAKGWEPILTVHDDLTVEVDDPGTDELRDAMVKELEIAMCDLPPCYEGLPIAAEGLHCFRLRKG